MGIIIRATIAYWFLLLILRIIGRRGLNQTTPFELILMFMMGGMSIQAVVADDRSMVGALLGVTTVGMNHIFVAWLKQRAIWFRKFADGTPIPVIEQGNWNEERMKKMRLQEQDVMSAARSKGIGSLDDIDMAVVERNGEISIFKKAA